MAFSERQVLLLTIMQKALEYENKPYLSLSDIAERIQQLTGETLKHSYLSKLISEVRSGHDDENRIIQSHFFKGKKVFVLRGASFVTRSDTARLLVIAQRFLVHSGNLNHLQLLEAIGSEVDLREEEIGYRLAWATTKDAGYIEETPDGKLLLSARFYDELAYLENISRADSKAAARSG